MARKDVYICDRCGSEKGGMDGVKISLMFGSSWLLVRYYGAPAANVHVCRQCATDLLVALENTCDSWETGGENVKQKAPNHTPPKATKQRKGKWDFYTNSSM